MLYRYEARSEGKTTKGEIEAGTQEEAVSLLQKKGVIVLHIAPKRAVSPFWGHFKKRVPLKDKILFTKQLAVMIRAGLPLDQALKVLAEQIPSRRLGGAIKEIAREVEGGKPLSQSMKKHTDLFPGVYINLIKSGEQSGKLEEVLFRLSEQQEKDYELISRVRGAMIYPAVIFSVLIAVVIIIILFVMPQIAKIFADLEVPLPLPTRLLLAFSSLTRRWFPLVILLLVGLALGARIVTRRSAEARKKWDALKLKLPIFGPLGKRVAMARFTRTTATLLTAGLPMLEILDTGAEVVGNLVFEEALRRTRHQVEVGTAMSAALRNEKVIPTIVSQVVAIGEKSGNLDFALSNIADFYDKEVEAITRNLSSVLEPILMILIGIGVGFVVISVIGPIYNLINVT